MKRILILSTFITFLAIILMVIFGVVVTKPTYSANSSDTANVTGTVKSEPPIIYDIRVFDLKWDKAKFSWRTDIPAFCQLVLNNEFIFDENREHQDEYKTEHKVELYNLNPDTTYTYYIRCYNTYGDMSRSEDLFFKTDKKKKEVIEIIPITIGGVDSPFLQSLIGAVNELLFDWGNIANLPGVETVYLGSLLALAGILIANLFIPLISNLPMLSFLDQIYSWFMTIFIYGKRKRWGIVYDSESREPIPNAIVRIFRQLDNKILETQHSDKEGRFGFMVSPGKYFITAEKKDYTFPSKETKADYHKEIFEVKDKNTVLSIDVPIDPNLKVLGSRLNLVGKIVDILNVIRIPLMVFGTILSLSFYINDPNILNTILVIAYFILWIAEIYWYLAPRLFGNVHETKENIPISYSIIRVYDERTNKLVSTKVSNTEGQYYHLIEPGKYRIVTTKANYKQTEIKDLSFHRGDILTKDITLQKE